MKTTVKNKPTTIKSLVNKIRTLKTSKKGRGAIRARLDKDEAGSVALLQEKLVKKTLRGEDRTTVAWLFA